MTAGPHFLVLAILLLPVGYADGQTLPWSERGATPPAAAPVQPGSSVGAQAVSPVPGMSPVDGGMPSCVADFLAKLRERMKDRVGTAMARHATREEMCMRTSYLAKAEAGWVKYIETTIQTCNSIPPQIVNLWKQQLANTEQWRVAVCAVSPRMLHMDDLPSDDGGE